MDSKHEVKPDSLLQAIEALGAVEVAPGRYAYQRNPSAPWCVFDDAALHNLAANLGPGGKGYGPWAFTLEYAEMPSWWSPERRTIVRCKHGRADYESCADASCGMGDGEGWERITASLITGEEEPCR